MKSDYNEQRQPMMSRVVSNSAALKTMKKQEIRRAEERGAALRPAFLLPA
ncbi:MAG: hypothetical protein WCA00_06010 [Candidatus Acidiferrales bacterium]